jgi:hypothetical protein
MKILFVAELRLPEVPMSDWRERMARFRVLAFAHAPAPRLPLAVLSPPTVTQHLMGKDDKCQLIERQLE